MNFISQKTNRDVVLLAKVVHIACSALLMACGLIATFWNFKGGLHIAVGIACILIGGAGILGYFSNDSYRLAFQSDFALGVFDIILGFMILFGAEQVIPLLPVSVGILCILDGGNKGQISFEGANFGMHFWYLVTACATVEIGVGIATVFCAYKDIRQFFWIGLAMFVIGAVNMFTTFYTVRLTNNKQNLFQVKEDN